ncbi:hypothetical protein BH23ACT11_BH23ACT11_11960 [soil metagenome]
MQLCLVMASEASSRYRIIDVQSARMPDMGNSHRAIVLQVSEEPEAIESMLIGEGTGNNVYASLVPAGAGQYTFGRYGSLLLLAYTLNEVEDSGDVWDQLNIRSESVYLVTGTSATVDVKARANLLSAAGSVLTLEHAPQWLTKEFHGSQTSPGQG